MSYGLGSSDLLGGPQAIYWGPLVCLSHSLNLNFSWSFSFYQAHNWNIPWFALLATAGAFGLLSDGGKQPMGRSSCKLDILYSIMGSSRSFILLAWMFSFWWNCLCLPHYSIGRLKNWWDWEYWSSFCVGDSMAGYGIRSCILFPGGCLPTDDRAAHLEDPRYNQGTFSNRNGGGVKATPNFMGSSSSCSCRAP
jgi:hypothetical protein